MLMITYIEFKYEFDLNLIQREPYQVINCI